MERFMYIKNFQLGFVLSILLITACSSTPKQTSADMTGINVEPAIQEIFKSSHGCFEIENSHAKNEFLITPCYGTIFKDASRMAFSYGLSTKTTFDSIADPIFVDVFNEFKESHNYLNGCSATDLIRKRNMERAGITTIELLYKCEEK